MNIKALYDIALNKSLVESKVKARQRKLAGEGEGRVVWRCFINFNYEPISWPFRFKIFGLEFGVWSLEFGGQASRFLMHCAFLLTVESSSEVRQEVLTFRSEVR